MASYIFIAAWVVVAGVAQTAPTLTLDKDTCGLSIPCGPNDTFQALCPASSTCTEYLDCDRGVATIKKCDRPFYLFWLTPVYTATDGGKCCQLVFKFTPIRPDEHGRCPEADKDTNTQVKRHTETSESPQVEPPQEVTEPGTGSVFNSSKSNDAQETHKHDDSESEAVTPETVLERPETIEGDIISGRTSSAALPSMPFLALVFAILSFRYL